VRDDFSAHVKEVLAKRVGYLCSNPDCQQSTAGPQEDSSKAVNIGVAAHITAASPGGPRFDDTLTPEQRTSHENGIWLCQNHGKHVDSDSNRFPVSRLRKWKANAEAHALQAIVAPARRTHWASSVDRDGICRALLELHDTGVHKVLNTARPPQHLRDSYPLEWLRKAQQWDAEVHRVMIEVGCEPGEVHFVHTFTLGSARRSDLKIPDLNGQWTICDMRRERLEKVIDRYSLTPIFSV
jgi:hypothetical protein